MISDYLKASIRDAGGIVHKDGNIFFKNPGQFLEASEILKESIVVSNKLEIAKLTEEVRTSELDSAKLRLQVHSLTSRFADLLELCKLETKKVG